MIRCTPVCGPAPVRKCVRILPSGVRTAKCSVVVPGSATLVGPCQSSLYSFAGAIVGGAGRAAAASAAGADEGERDQRRAAPPDHWPSGNR